MGTVSTYLSSVEGPERVALERIYALARETVPEAVEGSSYGMAALLYREKGLVAAVRTAKSLSIYPFSGAVVTKNLTVLSDFETTKGSIRFSVQNQLPEATVRDIIQTRRAEIDARAR